MKQVITIVVWTGALAVALSGCGSAITLDLCQGVDCSGLDDECNLGACTDGACAAVPRIDGTPCGSAAMSECDFADSCVAGTCAPNYAAAGTDCGDQGVECLVDDECDGAGACTDNGADTGSVCGSDTGMTCSAGAVCLHAASCAQVLANVPSASDGTYTIDLDGEGGSDPLMVSCDMTTDGGGWTLVFHVYDLGGIAGFSEDDFITEFGDNNFTIRSWTWDSLMGIRPGNPDGLISLTTQGAISTVDLDGLWSDVRMTCNLNDSDASVLHFAMVDGYTTLNGNTQLLGAATNGTSYTVPASSNSMGLTQFWHDNETDTNNSGHFNCDVGNDNSPGNAAPQFGFCYTDHLNNPNGLEQGDSIVSISFAQVQGSDGHSPGFIGECGDMDAGSQINAGTYSIWVR